MIERITREEIKAKLDGGAPIVIVEALPASYYAVEHLPGALNLPHDQVNELAPVLLPDKDAEIVTYCANGPCPNSEIAAQRLVALGYTNVREYHEGKQDWIEAGLPVESGFSSTQPAKKHEIDTTTRERVQELVAQVEQGKVLEAFDELYADDVIMQENGSEPTLGKAANLEREEGFVAAVAEVHENRAESVLVDGDRAAIHWMFDFTNKGGHRIRLDQIAQQTWREGRIVQERFYYDSAAVAVS